MDRERRTHSSLGLIAIFTFLASAQYCYGERIRVNDGLGWDGVRYAMMVRRLPDMLHCRRLNRYHLRRVLPSAVVRTSMQVFGVRETNQNIVRAFVVYNAVVIGLAIHVWALIAGQLGLSRRGLWTGFIGLVGSVAVAKMPFYYAPLTDPTALLLGFLTLHAWLGGQGVLLFLTAAMAAFTWPTAYHTALLLFILPGRMPVPVLGASATRQVWPTALAAAGALAALLVTLGREAACPASSIVSESRPPQAHALSLLLMGLFVFASLRALLSGVDFTRMRASFVQSLSPGRLALAAGLALAVRCYLAAFRSRATGFSPHRYVNEALQLGAAHPAAFLLGHAVYFGPLILVAVLLWGSVCAAVRRAGWGMLVVVAAYLLLGLDGESRRLTNAYPFFLAFTALAMDRRVVEPRPVLLLGALGVLFSKMWMPFNGPQLFEAPDGFHNYFMNIGGAMTLGSYLAQGAVVLTTLLALRLALPKPRVDAPAHP